MNWFDRMKSGFKTRKKKDIPDGIWTKCEACNDILYRRELERLCWVCPHCGHHFRTGGMDYIKILVDDGTFEEINSEMTSVDPLRFRDRKRYTDRIRDGKKATGMNSAICTGLGQIGEHLAAVGSLDCRFIMGSMGSVVGEKVARLIDRAIQDNLPLIIVSQSGGARMMESALSLMQMAKVSAKLAHFTKAGLLYISVLTDPTTAGVTASFAMLGDINIGEPGALIGFAGPRIIKETIGRDELPGGFQKAESVLEHGFLDMVVPRGKMKATLVKLIEFFDQGQAQTV